MNAHQLDENGIILNTIEVASLEAFPNLVDAKIGGQRGDSVIDGIVIKRTPSKEEINNQILEELRDIDQKSIRAIREGDNIRIADYNIRAAALRLQLVK